MKTMSTASTATVDRLRALADKQKEQLQQQENIITAREQRLRYLCQQQQRQQSKNIPLNGQLREDRLKELRASTFGSRLQRRSDSCKSITCNGYGVCLYLKLVHTMQLSTGTVFFIVYAWEFLTKNICYSVYKMSPPLQKDQFLLDCLIFSVIIWHFIF